MSSKAMPSSTRSSESARKSSMKEELIFKDGKTVMAPHLPTAPENLTNALETSSTFWVDHDAELNERFQAWLSQ